MGCGKKKRKTHEDDWAYAMDDDDKAYSGLLEEE